MIKEKLKIKTHMGVLEIGREKINLTRVFMILGLVAMGCAMISFKKLLQSLENSKA